METRDARRSTRPNQQKTAALFIALAILSILTVSAFFGVHSQTASPRPSNASFTSCGAPTVITVAQLESLTTAGIVPDKRSLTPPCSVTYNGKTYPTYVELDGITIIYSPYTGDCDAVVTGYCDVHLEFACTISAGCLFEIDQTWFAAGYNYPVNTQGAGSVTQGTVVNATGFLYIDDHGIHELHPTVSVSVWGVPPPPSCGNGAIDPPSCITCPIGYIMQNGTCVIPPSPLSTSFTFAPGKPSINSVVTFASMPIGGTPPYIVNWNFGDGNTGAGISTTHTFSKTGSFTVTETTTDSSSSPQTSSSSKSLTVSSPPPPGPVANFVSAPSSSALVGQIVSFSGSASGGTAPYAYSWDFGDGGSASGASPTYAYTLPGIYTVTLTIGDSGGLSGTASSIMAVSNADQLNIPPTLTVPGDQTITTGQQLTFTINSTDPNPGEIVIVVARGLPSGATFDSDTYRFNWTPNANQVGTIGVMFVAADNGSPPMSSSKPVTIHVLPAARGGGSGGSGGYSGGSSGCIFCARVGPLTAGSWLILFGSVTLLITPIVMMNIRASSKLGRTKRRLRELGKLS